MSAKTKTNEIERHYRTLGCRNTEQYQAWCRANGLPTRRHKAPMERKRELDLYAKLKGDQALKGVRRFERHPEEVLRDIAHGNGERFFAEQAAHRKPYLESVRRLFATIPGRPAVRTAFLKLLVCAHHVTDLQHPGSVVGRYGRNVTGNTLSEGLLAVAHWSNQWRRPLDGWSPGARKPQEQFAELVHHLFCQWPVPGFLNSAWFSGTHGAAKRAQEWFIKVGSGVRPRDLDLPFHLTNRMAHIAMNDVPPQLTVEEGWRWAQVVGMGGTRRQAEAIIATRLGESFADEPFWATVIRFLVDNPLLDPERIGPLVDYLYYERVTPRRSHDSPNRLPEGFEMKGRTATALLSRMEEWHRELNRERAGSEVAVKWLPSGIGEYICNDKLGITWRITEITTAKDLAAEGSAMSHCVATYAASCARGAISVWSLTASTHGDPVRVMTAAVNRNRYMSEARGKRNALPTKDAFLGVRVGKEEAGLLVRGRRIVAQWAAAEQLVLPHYLEG
jgi:hypothetical protein